MPGKTFDFGVYPEKVLLELLELYLRSTALCELLRGIVEEEGRDALGADGLVHEWDQRFVRILRETGKL